MPAGGVTVDLKMSSPSVPTDTATFTSSDFTPKPACLATDSWTFLKSADFKSKFLSMVSISKFLIVTDIETGFWSACGSSTFGELTSLTLIGPTTT
jgi:hypothetical protein